MSAAFIELDGAFVSVASIRIIRTDFENNHTTVEFIDGTTRTFATATGSMDDLATNVIPAAPAWKLAEFRGGKVHYATILAFAVSPDGCLTIPRTMDMFDPDYSAVVDPNTGSFFTAFSGNFENEEAFKAAMVKLISEDAHNGPHLVQ